MGLEAPAEQSRHWTGPSIYMNSNPGMALTCYLYTPDYFMYQRLLKEVGKLQYLIPNGEGLFNKDYS